MAAVQSIQPLSPVSRNHVSVFEKVPNARSLQQQQQLLESSSQNICRISALLKDTNLLPERFVIPENHRPRLSHDAFLPEVELPMIDFQMARISSSSGSSSSSLMSLAHEVGNACRDWGFFQIANHGVPAQLIAEMESHARDFFSLPYQQKEKAAIFSRPLGYNGRYKDMASSAPWVEAMAMQLTPHSTVDTSLDRVWPHGNSKLRRAIRRYQGEMEKLGRTIVELLALSLGLEREAFARHFERSSSTTLRWNHYPPCPQPSKALGLHAHSDPSGITILHQDNVGGLQIRKDGRWIAVKPRPDTFIINLGDLFQAWTNGRYKSIEHRAVVNKKVERFSMVFFYSPDEDYSITPPAPLVDAGNPLQYRPFTWGEYSSARLNIPSQGKRHLEMFAGV